MVAVSLTRLVETHHMLLAALVELLVSAMHSKKVRQFTPFIFFKINHRSTNGLSIKLQKFNSPIFKSGECERGAGCRFSHGDDNAYSGGGGGGYSGRYQARSGARDNNAGKSGTCYAFQRGECERGDGCRYSHSGEGEF